MATRGKQSRRGTKNSSKTSLLNSDFEEPPKKRTKLINSSLSSGEKVLKRQTTFMRVALNDALSLVHTSLCGASCTFKHHPLVLSFGVKPDHRLRKCLENYLKLAVKTGWTSQTAPYDSCLSARYPLMHLAVLFGKLDPLEFLLNSNSEACEYLDSDGNSPLHTALNNLNNFAPTSVWEDKAEIFQQIMGCLAKYNSHVLCVRDGIYGDSILHLCAKKIRDLSVKIKNKVSSSHEATSNSDLQTQRSLYERCFKVMLEKFQSLCTEETLHENDVRIVFDGKNIARETILNILEDDELTREVKRFSCLGEVSAADITQGAGNCDSFKETQGYVQQQNSSTVVGEEKNSCEHFEGPSVCAEQQAGKAVDEQLGDTSETGMLTEQTDGNSLNEMLEYGYNMVKESLQCTLVETSKLDNQQGENPHVLIDELEAKEKDASISLVKSSQIGRQSLKGDDCDDLVKSYQLNQEQILEHHTSNFSVKTVKARVEEGQTVHVAVMGESLQTERQEMSCETYDPANKSSQCQVKPAESISDCTSAHSSSESVSLRTARCVPVEKTSETERQRIGSEKFEHHGNKSKFHENENTAVFMDSDTSKTKSKTDLPQKRNDSCTCLQKSPAKGAFQESVWESFERPKKPLGDEHEKEAKEQKKVYLLLRETESESEEVETPWALEESGDCDKEQAKITDWDSSQETKECDELQNETTICVIKEESPREERQQGKGIVGLFEQSPLKEQTVRTNIDMTEERETIGLMQRGTPKAGAAEQTSGIARRGKAKEKCESQERQLEYHGNQIGMSDSGSNKEQIQTGELQQGTVNCVKDGSLEGSEMTDLPQEESPDTETQKAIRENFESMEKLVDIKTRIASSYNSSDNLVETDIQYESPGRETQEMKGKTSGTLEMSLKLSDDQPRVTGCDSSVQPMETGAQTATVNSMPFEASLTSEKHVDSEPLEDSSGSSNGRTKVLKCDSSEEPLKISVQRRTVTCNIAPVEESRKGEIHVESKSQEGLSGCYNDQTKITECDASEEPIKTGLQKETVDSAIVEEPPKIELLVDSEPLEGLSGSNDDQMKIIDCDALVEQMQAGVQREIVDRASIEESHTNETLGDAEILEGSSGSNEDNTKITECYASAEPMDTRLQKETVNSAIVEESQKSELHLDSEPLQDLSGSNDDQTSTLECMESEEPMETRLQKETVNSAIDIESQKNELHVDSEPLEDLSGSSNDQTKILECGASEEPTESHLRKETVNSATVEESQKSDFHVDSEPLDGLSAESGYDQTKILECGASEEPTESHLQKETVNSAIVKESRKSELHVDSEPLEGLSERSYYETKILECGTSVEPMEIRLQTETVNSAIAEELLERTLQEAAMKTPRPLKKPSECKDPLVRTNGCSSVEEQMLSHLQERLVASVSVAESQGKEMQVAAVENSAPLEESLECKVEQGRTTERVSPKERTEAGCVEEVSVNFLSVERSTEIGLKHAAMEDSKVRGVSLQRRDETTRLKKNILLMEPEETDALQEGTAVCVTVEESFNNVRQEVARETLASSQGLLECDKGMTKISICVASAGLVKGAVQMDEPSPDKKLDEYTSERPPAENIELLIGQTTSSDGGSLNEEVRSIKEINVTVETAVQDDGERAGNVNGECLNVSLDAEMQEIVSSCTMDTSLQTEPNEIEKKTCEPLRETSVDAGEQLTITHIGSSLQSSKSTEERNTDKDLEIRENSLEDGMDGSECTKPTEERNTDKDLEIRENSIEDGMEGSECTKSTERPNTDKDLEIRENSLEDGMEGSEYTESTEKPNTDKDLEIRENSLEDGMEGSKCTKSTEERNTDKDLEIREYSLEDGMEGSECTKSTEERNTDKDLEIRENSLEDGMEGSECTKSTERPNTDKDLEIRENSREDGMEGSECTKSTEERNTDKDLEIRENSLEDGMEGSECTKSTEERNTDKDLEIRENSLEDGMESSECTKSTERPNTDKDLEIRENSLEDGMESSECTKSTERPNTDKDLEIRENSLEDGMEGSSQIRTINLECRQKSYETVEGQQEIHGQDRAINLDSSIEFSDTTEKQNSDGNSGSMENSRQCERHGSGEERTISPESAQDSFHAIDKQKRAGNLVSSAISVNFEMQGCADISITSIESVQKVPPHTEKGTTNWAISSRSRNCLGLEMQASDQLKAANLDCALEQSDSTRENEDVQIGSSVNSLESQVLGKDQVNSVNLESTQESSDTTGEQKQDTSLGSSVISLEFEKQDKDEVSCANLKSAQGLAGRSEEEGQDRNLGSIVNSIKFETQNKDHGIVIDTGSPPQARQCFEASGALYTSSGKSPRRGIHEMGKRHSGDLQHQSPPKRPRIGSTDCNMLLQTSGCVTQHEVDLQGGSLVENSNHDTQDAVGIQCDLLDCEVPQDTSAPIAGQGVTKESNTLSAQSPPSGDPIVSIDTGKKAVEHPQSEALTSDTVPVCFVADEGVNQLKEELDRTRSPPLTLLVSRVKPQPKEVKLPKGIHPSSCPRGCIFIHHELVQLLCATPDYHSTEVSEDENEACVKFGEFLKNTAWNLDAIVPDPCYQLCRPVLHLACMLGKLKALGVLAEIGFNPLVRSSYWETALHATVHLLGYGSTAYLFLPQVFVNIVKILRRYSTTLSLLSAADVTGNTVFHSLAYKVASERFSSVVFYYAFLFRISVSFLLSEHHGTVGVDEVVKLLESSNKAGQTVKQILEAEVIGRQLLKSVTYLLESGTHVSKTSDEAGPSGFKPFMNEKLKTSGCVSEGPCDGSDNLSDTHRITQPVNGDPESLVDFILSKDFNITDSTKDLIFQSFDDEYVDRIRRLNRKIIPLKKDWRDVYFLELKEEALQTQEAELKAVKANIEQSRTSETVTQQEMKQLCHQEREVSAKINLVDETIIALQEIEGSMNRMSELEMSKLRP